MWCHLPLAMPALGLALFLILPWQGAAPSYLMIVALSAILYWKIAKAMRLPVVTGAEGLTGKRGRVVARNGDSFAPYLVRVSGELWQAEAEQDLVVGEEVAVVALKGNRVIVHRASDHPPTVPT